MACREFYEVLPSTQDRAIALARAGAADGSRVVARRQTHGRGRGDRSWSSPPGGLYLSIVLRPVGSPGVLPLAIGAELASALSERYRVRLRLKWPNDLLAVDGGGDARKLGGVLVDVVPAPEGPPAAVAGIGVNGLRSASGLPAEVRASAVALDELTDEPVELGRLEAVVAGAALAARGSWADPRRGASTVARCRGLLYGVGEPVTVDGRRAGTLAGLGDDGSLRVDSPEGPRAFLTGHVQLGVGG